MKETINTKLLKYLENFDEDFNIADFSPEELEELLNSTSSDIQKFKENYFKKYDDVKSSSLKRQDW